MKAPKMKKNRRLLDRTLLLPRGKRNPKLEILQQNKLNVPLTLFLINVGGGTWVIDDTPRMITRPRSILASSNRMRTIL